MMNALTIEQQTILRLLRKTMWGENVILPDGIDWAKVDTMAQEQGVTAFVYDGVRDLHTDVPGEILQKWLRKLIAGVSRNEMLMRAQDEIVRWFAEADIPAVILKGSSVSRYYPQPDLRALGDIDILVGKADCEKAQKILEEQGYTYIESDHGFHVSLSRKGVHVELHYQMTGFPDSEGGRLAMKEAEHFLDSIAQGAVGNHQFPVLTESNQALSLLLHMIRHMFENGIGMRQVCDWAMYVASADRDHFEEITLPMLKRSGLEKYARIATKACVSYLGLPDEKLSWCANVTAAECWLFVEQVFRDGNMGSANKGDVGSLFTDSHTMGEDSSALRALIVSLTELSYKNFPVSRKHKLLLPFFWMYLPVRYMVRSKLGLRPEKSVSKVVQSAKQHRTLYDVLKPFDREN